MRREDRRGSSQQPTLLCRFISARLQKKAEEARFLPAALLYQLLSRSRCACQYCVCLCCDVRCAAASLPDAPVLHPPLLCLSLLPIPPLRLRNAAVLSPSLTVRVMFGPWCRFHSAGGITSLFSSLSPYSPWRLSVEAVFSPGYLTASPVSSLSLSYRQSQSRRRPFPLAAS